MKFKSVYRVVTFIPPANVERIISTVTEIAPLSYGKYDGVAWVSAPGVERYRPLPGSDPTSGEVGKVSKESSVRLEFSIPMDSALLDRVIKDGIIAKHDWEEPVIIVFEARETRNMADEDLLA